MWSNGAQVSMLMYVGSSTPDVVVVVAVVVVVVAAPNDPFASYWSHPECSLVTV